MTFGRPILQLFSPLHTVREYARAEKGGEVWERGKIYIWAGSGVNNQVGARSGVNNQVRAVGGVENQVRAGGGVENQVRAGSGVENQ